MSALTSLLVRDQVVSVREIEEAIQRQVISGGDIDTVLVRPSGVGESDEPWSDTVQQWIDRVSDVSGNSVEVLEVPEDELPAKLDGGGSVWQEIKRDALLIHGTPLATFRSVASG